MKDSTVDRDIEFNNEDAPLVLFGSNLNIPLD
jgi:hypothetical protein